MAKDKVVLAYSGGLDTSAIIPWLKETYDLEVIAFCADVGQGEELEPLNEKAIRSGASKLYIEDLREEFVTDFIFPVMQAGAVYEKKYLLGTSFARPLIAKKMVEIARKEGAKYIAHGATGKGNDQVRFELSVKAFAPDIKVIAPWRDPNWKIRSREDALKYVAEHGIEIQASNKVYSQDRNLWHISHEGSDLEDPWNVPKYDDMLTLTTAPAKAPDKVEYVDIDFEQGVPVAVNGKKMAPLDLMYELNRIGGENGVGITAMTENRLVGMKSRGVYETPGGTILYAAHNALEELTLDRRTMKFKQVLAIEYAELVYDGNWYSQLRQAMAAFVASTQQNCTGTARVRLYKGSCEGVAAKSPYSLYNEELVTFGEDDVYTQSDATGFINLFGLPLKVKAMVEAKNK